MTKLNDKKVRLLSATMSCIVILGCFAGCGRNAGDAPTTIEETTVEASFNNEDFMNDDVSAVVDEQGTQGETGVQETALPTNQTNPVQPTETQPQATTLATTPQTTGASQQATGVTSGAQAQPSSANSARSGEPVATGANAITNFDVGSVNLPGSSVLYTNGAEKFIFIPESTDLFGNFKEVMPGDSIDQTVNVKNCLSKKSIAIYLRAEPVEEIYRDFLDNMTITVKQDGKTVLSNAPASSTGGLAENVLLGDFAPDAYSALTVTLNVSPDMGNEFQDTTGKIVWVFSVEERDYDNPKTGDEGNEDDMDIQSILIVAGCATFIASVYVLSKISKKKREKNNPSVRSLTEEDTPSES